MRLTATHQVLALALVVIIGFLAGSAAAQQATAQPQPGTKLSIEELKAQAFHVSAGRRLKPDAWPNGARVAVSLSFDVDNASPNLARGDLGSEPLSQGEYGARDAMPRILRLLDKHDVPASFFFPAVSALLHPEMVTDVLARDRHEVGVHGWIHESLPNLESEAEEKRLLDQSIDTMTQLVGKRPVGYRAPAWRLSQHTMKLVKEAGFLYDSSLMASDDAYEVLLDGQPTGIVELPIERLVDDYPYFGYGSNGSLPLPDLVQQIFRAEFDVAYEEGGLLVLTFHPHIVGHRSRVAALDALLSYIKSKPGVWFATHEEVARYVKGATTSKQ